MTLLPSLNANSRPVARHQFWRSANMRHSAMLRDISQKLLFSYIVRNYDLLIMEDSASNEGKFYWLRQVSRAIERGLHVYASDVITQELKPLSTQRALKDMQNQAWSCTDPYSLRASSQSILWISISMPSNAHQNGLLARDSVHRHPTKAWGRFYL